METAILKEKLEAAKEALKQTERMFHQLSGQVALLEGLIKDYGEKDVIPKEEDPRKPPEGSNT